MEMKKLKIMAHRMPSTSNPVLMILSAKIIIIASSIIRKSPNVIMVTGMVRTTKMGLTNMFSNAKTIEITMAVLKEETTTCGSRT
jgi:hypothetical protein